MINQANTGVIVVDVQGRLSELVQHSDELVAQIVRLLQGAALFSLPVVAMEQIPEKLGSTRAEIAALLPSPALAKTSFSGLGNADIARAIQNTGRRHFLLVGIEAHVCVYQTAVDLLQAGFGVHLVVDAISSRTLSNQTLAIKKLQTLGAQLTSTEMALFELMRDAQDEKFKDFIQIIK